MGRKEDETLQPRPQGKDDKTFADLPFSPAQTHRNIQAQSG